MLKQTRQMLVALLLVVAFLSQVTWALAGTTGGLSGSVVDETNGSPIANAMVTASSPSQTASIKTDGAGHFLFISLIPDTYTVSVEKDGYDPSSQSGLSIFADATQQYTLRVHKTLKEIAKVTSRSASNLVKAGQTADVYSVNATTQDKVSALGGGGSLNSAYSAIASVPGAFVPLNQTGYFQTVHIRGGDYDQVGYEVDGVPVNRAFDNYPSGSASSLGQQELQVYTGATPANSEGQGLAGYINQVIRTGTFPGFGLINVGVGGPSYYHKIAAEVGGASPNRDFSYYVGVGGYNQGFRYVDNNNGASFSNPISGLGPPALQNADLTYTLFNYPYGALADISDRDTIVNLHFALPHKGDGLRDDLQVLWDSGSLFNSYYSSPNDMGGPMFFDQSAGPVPAWSDSYQYTGAAGVPLTAAAAGQVVNYYYPSSPSHGFQSALPANYRDNTRNNQEVIKLQYQKNFSANAYLRAYGYTYYSDWLNNGPNGAWLTYVGTGASPDYELNSHTRGASLQFADQLNEKNLLNVLVSRTESTTLRDNNTQMFNAFGKRSRGTVLVDAANPFNGVCYRASGAATTCDVSAPGSSRASFLRWDQIQGNTALPTAGVPCSAPGGLCKYYIMENSLYATYNTVKPVFGSYSITDQFRPNDKFLVNAGLRMDTFQFNGSGTSPNDPARQFWFNAWNLDHCINTATGAPADKVTALGLTPTSACPSGYTTANMVNASAQVQKYQVLQPRLGATYTVNSDTVLRASWGKYVEPPNSAFEQYNTLQENLPAFLGTAFYKFGFNTPGHDVRPPTSYNADISLEKHLRGTDWSYKLTPFMRKTKDQIQQFFLDQASGFVSGLNVGRQTSEGVEFQLNKGDFARNGLSGQLALTYTNSFINYDKLGNGTSIVSGMNADISAYNAFTKAGGGAACYTTAGAAAPACGAGTVANPYYNAPAQPLLDPNANYPTYDLFPGPIGSSAQAFGTPYLAALILNYKHDKWALTPSLQFTAGGRYGAPETTPGIDPSSCGTATGSPTGDPRYPYGAAGGQAYDATTCGTLNAIPNPYTGAFDNLGSFRQPSQLVANLQVRYDASAKVSLVGTFANIVNRCFGGTKAAWTLNDSNVCSYGILNNAGAFSPLGNVYNPGDPTLKQRFLNYPYAPYLGAVNVDSNSTKTPFNFFLEARIKI